MPSTYLLNYKKEIEEKVIKIPEENLNISQLTHFDYRN